MLRMIALVSVSRSVVDVFATLYDSLAKYRSLLCYGYGFDLEA